MAFPSSRLFLGLIPWYSILIVAGAVLCIWLSNREANRLGLPESTVIDLALLVIPIGIIGARLYYVCFSWPYFSNNPFSVFFIWEGGLAIYGGLISGFITIVVFSRKKNLSVFMVLDLVCPGVALAQSVSRWGNYFNHEAYGLALTNSSLCFFPMAVQIFENGMLVWHAATFFYESLMDLAIFIFLLIGRRRLFVRQGDVFFFYIFLYAAGRLCIENLRADSLYITSNIRISQLLSVLICLICLIILAARQLKSHPSHSIHILIASSFPLLCAVPVICFCFGLRLMILSSITAQMLFLSVFSLIIILSILILYFSWNTSEVCYANNADKKSDLPDDSAI